MKNRPRILELASVREYDLIIIGGGIVGAGIAQDAASRGLSVLLVERDDFASHTSSKTTKLIHGGLRYLESLHFKLTYELSRERTLLEHLAPHMVKDISFVLPLAPKNKLFSLKAKLGLTLYDLLAGNYFGTKPRHQQLSTREVVEAAPALENKDLIGGLRFHDAITDDARLVLTVLKSAVNHGAHVINYMEATSLMIENNVVRGVECKNRLDSSTIQIRCKACINAAGAFSDQIIKLAKNTWKPRIVPAKGTHIVLPSSAFPTNTGLFLPTADNRYVFVLPWQRALLVGTTDTIYRGDISNPLPENNEIDYLLQVINSYSNKQTINRSDITAAWSGIRPLIRPAHWEENKNDTSILSREHEVFFGPKGLINVIGGKLTNYRLMAEQVIDRTLERYPSLNHPNKRSRTRRLMLGGWLDKDDFLASTASISSQARKLALDPATTDHLISAYGKETIAILELLEDNPELKEKICADFPPVMAEIAYHITNEMAVSLEDVLSRRLRLAILNQQQCIASAPKVVQLMQTLLNWDNTRCQAELQALENSIANT